MRPGALASGNAAWLMARSRSKTLASSSRVVRRARLGALSRSLTGRTHIVRPRLLPPRKSARTHTPRATAGTAGERVRTTCGRLSALAIAQDRAEAGAGVIARQSGRIRSLADQVLGVQTEFAKTAQPFIWTSPAKTSTPCSIERDQSGQTLTGRLNELSWHKWATWPRRGAANGR